MRFLLQSWIQNGMWLDEVWTRSLYWVRPLVKLKDQRKLANQRIRAKLKIEKDKVSA